MLAPSCMCTSSADARAEPRRVIGLLIGASRSPADLETCAFLATQACLPTWRLPNIAQHTPDAGSFWKKYYCAVRIRTSMYESAVDTSVYARVVRLQAAIAVVWYYVVPAWEPIDTDIANR